MEWEQSKMTEQERAIAEEVLSMPVARARGEEETGTALREACSVLRYQNLVTEGTWDEIWLTPRDEEEAITVNGEIWTGAIQYALDHHKVVHVPWRYAPYYIDAPLVMNAGNHLIVDRHTEVRLKPFSNTCMVQNRNIVVGTDGPVVLGENPDTDIRVEGGVWTTLAFGGRSGKSGATLGKMQVNGNTELRLTGVQTTRAHGTMTFSNVRGLAVSDVTFRQCGRYALHVTNCSDFVIDGVYLDDMKNDGVHVNGPAKRGVIRNICGITGDDFLALTSWDWPTGGLTYGPISEILLENVIGPGGHYGRLRMLAGTKHFRSGVTLDCDIYDCVVRNLRGVHLFSLADQPPPGFRDFPDPVGRMYNLYFSGLDLAEPSQFPVRDTPDSPLEAATFLLASDMENINIRDVTVRFDPKALVTPPFNLAQIGPWSLSQDVDFTVKHLRIWDVRVLNVATHEETRMQPEDVKRYIRVKSVPSPGRKGRGFLK